MLTARLPLIAATLAAMSVLACASAAFADDYTIATANGADGQIYTTNTTFELIDPSDTIQGLGSGTLQISGDLTGNAQYTDNVNATLTTTTGTIDLVSDGFGFFSIFGASPISFMQAASNGDDLSYSTGAVTSTSNPDDYTFNAGGGSYATPAPESGSLISFFILVIGCFGLALRKRIGNGD